MKKAVGYIRVSTDLQADEGFGLDIQRQEIKEYCTQNEYELVWVYADEGVSGATLARPALGEMLDASDYEVVVVAKYDRLSRDLYGQLFIEKELNVKGAELISIREPFNGNSAEMQLMRQMMGAFAQFEKQRISQRLAAGRAHKRKQGGWAGGRAPLGYVSERGSKVLRLNPTKVETVQLLFRFREAGMTYTEIAERLNSSGHTTQDGKHFTPMQVKRALEREALYRGQWEAPAIL